MNRTPQDPVYGRRERSRSVTQIVIPRFFGTSFGQRTSESRDTLFEFFGAGQVVVFGADIEMTVEAKRRRFEVRPSYHPRSTEWITRSYTLIVIKFAGQCVRMLPQETDNLSEDISSCMIPVTVKCLVTKDHQLFALRSYRTAVLGL